MGRLIIDGNSVFEIDEQCLKKRKVPESCDIEKYLKDTKTQSNEQIKKQETK